MLNWTRSLLLKAAVAAALIPKMALAQEPSGLAEVTVSRISLAEALRRFEANNLELRLARAALAAAESRVVAARQLPNPGLTASREQLSDEGTSNHETLLALGQILEIGGQRRARGEAARGASAASVERLESERLRLVFEVHRAYVRGAVAEANLGTLAEATEVFRRVEESGRIRFAEGDISQYDRSRLQVERIRYETLLARAQLELEAAARELAILVVPDSLEVAALLPGEPLAQLRALGPVPARDAALAAAAERPDVRAADAEIDAARARLSLMRRERIPDLTLSAGYKQEGGAASGAVVGLSMPLPLWNRNQGEIAEAQAELDAAVARRGLALARAQEDIRRAWDNYRSLGARTSALGETLLPESAGLLETARIAYAEGEMSLVQLLDAADAYRSARESVNELLGGYLIALYDLQRATGGLLYPNSIPADVSSRQGGLDATNR
jgi:cobalt-zinc-cadmium efflux system outer membrane protein